MAFLYSSLIRPVNKDRKHFNTTLSKSLLDQIREIAKSNKSSYNFLLEEAMEWVLENYQLKGSFHLPPKPTDRVRINTTFSSKLFGKLKSRCKKLGKGIYANDLIEEGMKFVIDKYKKEDTL